MSRRNRNRGIFIAALILAILVLVVIIYGLPKVADSVKDTYVTEYDSIEQADEVTGYIIRNERVYAASISGEINYKIKEGTKVRRGIRIARVTGSYDGEKMYNDLIEKLGDNLKVQDSLKAARIGVVSYFVDGNEGRFNTKKIKDLKYSDVASLENDYIDLKRDKVAAGDPIYKIFRNNKWCIVYWVSPEEAERYEKGNRVSVHFEDGDIRATITGIKKQGDRVRITLRSNLYYKELAKTRVAKIRVVLRSFNGLSVENSSITEKKGVKGVMVKEPSGEYVFTPIRIIYQGEDTSLVSPNTFTGEDGKEYISIKAYDEILRNP